MLGAKITNMKGVECSLSFVDVPRVVKIMQDNKLKIIELIFGSIFSGFLISMVFVEKYNIQFAQGVVVAVLIILAIIFIGEVYLLKIEQVYHPWKNNTIWIMLRITIALLPFFVLFFSGIPFGFSFRGPAIFWLL